MSYFEKEEECHTLKERKHVLLCEDRRKRKHLIL